MLSNAKYKKENCTLCILHIFDVFRRKSVSNHFLPDVLKIALIWLRSDSDNSGKTILNFTFRSPFPLVYKKIGDGYGYKIQISNRVSYLSIRHTFSRYQFCCFWCGAFHINWNIPSIQGGYLRSESTKSIVQGNW